VTVAFNVLLVVVTAGALFFPVYYHVSTAGEWRHSPMGRHVMGYTAAAALLGVSGIFRVFLPDLVGQEWVRLLALTLAAVFIWQRNYIIVRAQNFPGDERTDRGRERFNEANH